MNDKPIFHLNLTRKWFDMIASGEKKEEYRDISDYWARRFPNGNIKVGNRYYHPSDVVICFSNGYAKNRPQIFVECLGLIVGMGLVEWGADPVSQYFVLKLGKKL